MNAERWQRVDWPWGMLLHLRDRASERKARLLGVAYVRQYAEGYFPEAIPMADIAERFADGEATDEERAEARAGYSFSLLAPEPAADVLLALVGMGSPERETRFASCELIRDIFGNPFRPVAFEPRWRTEAAVALAGGMYATRDFAPMPVLGDALEDAGCADPDILAHCRGPGPHVRGCWVVDLVLGKM